MDKDRSAIYALQLLTVAKEHLKSREEIFEKDDGSRIPSEINNLDDHATGVLAAISQLKAEGFTKEDLISRYAEIVAELDSFETEYTELKVLTAASKADPRTLAQTRTKMAGIISRLEEK